MFSQMIIIKAANLRANEQAKPKDFLIHDNTFFTSFMNCG